jgi:hypothetical protein
MDQTYKALEARIEALEEVLQSFANKLLRCGIGGLNTQDIEQVEEAIADARAEYEARVQRGDG